MNSINSFSSRPGFATFADSGGLGSGFLEVMPLTGVGYRLSQVIQVAHGDRCQRAVLRLPKNLTCPLTQLFDRLTTGRVMTLIHRRQQEDILFSVLLFKAGYGSLAALESTCFAVLRNQSGELLPGVTTDLHQVAHYHPFLMAGEAQIPKFDQFSLYPAVAVILVTDDRKGH